MVEEFLIRPVQEYDKENVYKLSNDNVVRANSINKSKILWKDHVEWFNNRIKNKEEPFYIAETSDGDFVAQIRFNKKDGDFVISISIDKKFRGKGLGGKIIKEATQKLNFPTVIAYVKTTNISSQKAFIKAGYKFQNTETINNELFEKFVYNQK